MNEIKITNDELEMSPNALKDILMIKILSFNMQIEPGIFKSCRCSDKKCKLAHPNKVNSVPTTMTKCPNPNCADIMCYLAH